MARMQRAAMTKVIACCMTEFPFPAANPAGLRLHSTQAAGKGERRKGQWQRVARERQKSGPEWFEG
ncbi:hypothetical protein KAM338_05570 [Aeromonas caviae]|nr:hypothetical protein KAM338_05570 [Aeromonas caviae]